MIAEHQRPISGVISTAQARLLVTSSGTLRAVPSHPLTLAVVISGQRRNASQTNGLLLQSPADTWRRLLQTSVAVVKLFSCTEKPLQPPHLRGKRSGEQHAATGSGRAVEQIRRLKRP